MKNKNCFVCHYAEIGLKGGNRRFFEDRLVRNIKEVLSESRVEKKRGRILVFTKNEERTTEILRKVCGIAYFFPARILSSSMEEMEKEVLGLSREISFESFRVTVKRSDKSFPLSSQEVARRIGALIKEETGKEVDLHSPEANFRLEITPQETYLFWKRFEGVGGLPVGSGGSAVSLLSGGIDSPVSSFRIMKRGVKNIFLHFHAYPVTSAASMEKARSIVRILSSYQGRSVLYMIPFANIQKEIMINTKEKLRVVLYRRFMMRAAQKIAEKEGAGALITGESLGQVASQTLENMRATEEVVDLPVLRPLTGYDKEEIIKEARRLETYSLSILPEEDCCVRFLPRFPETRARLSDIREEEENLEVESMVEEMIRNCKKELFYPDST